MKLGVFSIKDMQIIKCFAILMIVLHNFLHSFPEPRQNEFSYERLYFDQFLQIISSSPELLFQAIFSYLGHFGVQVFIIVSAYGLTISHGDAAKYYVKFVFSRMKKIYPAFILAIMFWLILRVVYALSKGEFTFESLELPAIIYKLLLISSFIPNYELEPVGPWWFIPFIFQFYLIFPFLISVYARYGNRWLVLCSFFGFIAGFSAPIVPFGIYYTVFPHLPLICLGIFLAKTPQFEFKIELVLLCFLIFVLGNYNKYFFVFTHLTAGLLFFGLFVYLKNSFTVGGFLERITSYLGKISLQIFLVNGFCRTPMFEWALADGRWFMMYFYMSISFAITMFISNVLYLIEKYIRKI